MTTKTELKLATEADATIPRTPKTVAECDPGITPVEFKVLVLPSDVEVDPAFARARKLGIQLPQDVQDRELMAQIVALLVSTGGNAFEDWKPAVPKPGDRVLIAKYAGVTIRGADGFEYRMLNDKDIAGIISKEGVSRV